MQEKERIHRQLAHLHEEGLRDHLELKLRTIASQEVVNDIIREFIDEHNKEFLNSVAESIAESKQTIRHLREGVDLMRREGQKEREMLKEECKQEHYLEMSAVKEELRAIKGSLQNEQQHHVAKVQDVQRELESSLRINQELKENLEKNKVIIDQMNTTITKLNIQIKQNHIRISQQEEKVFQNSTQNVEKQRQYQQEIINIKNEYINRERQLRQHLKRQEERNMGGITQQYELKLENLLQKVYQMQLERNKKQEKMAQITHQSQRKALQNKQAVLKNELITQSLKKTQLFLQKKEEQCQFLQRGLHQEKQLKKELQLKIQSIQEKKLEYITKRTQQISQLKEYICKLEKQREILTLEKGYIEQKMTKQRREYEQTLAKYKNQTIIINNHMLEVDKSRKDYEQRLSKEMQLNLMNQEEIKNLLKCNAIQQQEISKLELNIMRIQEQSRAQIMTYQQTFAINVQDLQSEVAALKIQNEKLRTQMRGMQHDLQLQSQTEKYYHHYIQEIATLKRELAQCKLNSHQLSSFKNDRLIQHLPKLIVQLSRQNHKLRQTVQNEMNIYQQQFKQSFKLLFTMIQQKELKQAHSNYLTYKSRSPQKQQTFMDKTLPRQQPQKSNMVTMKQSLKQIQQRYQKAHNQNQSFTMRIDSFLNNS